MTYDNGGKGGGRNSDIDTGSLRFGAPEEVDFGRGCRAQKVEKSGKDLIVPFNGAGNRITDKNFAARLIGKTANGKLLFGYARLPGVDYTEPPVPWFS